MKKIISRILVAISGSEASIAAAKYAIVFAKQYDCLLSAVYVVDTATIHSLMLNRIFVKEEGDEYEHSLEANGLRYLAYIQELTEEKHVKVQTYLRKGGISTEIISLADEIDTDCIFLGGWEKDRQSCDIIQESQRQILMCAHCSVHIVKEPDIDSLYKNL